MNKKQYEKEIKDKLDKTIIEELRKLNKTQDIEESVVKYNYLVNVSKILDNYTLLEPILKKYFSDKLKKDKEIQNESWDSISK